MVKKAKFWLKAFITLVIAIGSWAVFNLVRVLLEGSLIKLGVESEAKQMLVIIGLVLIILTATGLSFRKQIIKMIG